MSEYEENSLVFERAAHDSSNGWATGKRRLKRLQEDDGQIAGLQRRIQLRRAVNLG